MSPYFSLIAAAAAGPLETDQVIVGVIAAAAVVFTIVAVVVRERRKGLAVRERELAAFQERNRQEESQRERDSKAYSQHINLNELTARKIDLETKVLQAQLDAADRDRTAREQHEEYHRLMIQKTELEVQSLKLHIREQRKRIDDFTSYDDE